MESIKFRCTSCSKKLSIKASRIGSTVVCPSCESSIIVPSEGLPDEKTVEELRYKLAAAQKEASKLMTTELALKKAKATISSFAEVEDKLTLSQRKNEELAKELKSGSERLKEAEAEHKTLLAKIDQLGRDKSAAENDLKTQRASEDSRKDAEGKAAEKHKAALAELGKERDALKAKLADAAKADAKSATSEAAELKVVRAKLEEFKAGQEKKRKEFEDQLTIARNKTEAVEKKLQEAERIKPALQDRDEELQKLKDALAEAEAERDTERGKLTGTVPAADYGEIKAALAQAKAELDTARKQAKQLVDPDRLQKAEAAREGLHEKLVTEQTKAARLESELESQRQILEDERAEAERAREELERQVSVLDKNHLTTFSELETGKQLLASLKIDHEKLQAEQTKTLAAAKGAQSRLDEAVRKREDLEVAGKELQGKLDAAKARIDELQNQSKKANEAKDGQHQQLSRLQAEQEATEKRLADQARELESLRGLPDRLEEFKAKADSADQRYEQLRATVAEYESGTARVDEERSRLTGKLDKLEQRLQIALEEKSHLKRVNEEFASKLRHVKGQFDDYKSEYNETRKTSANKAERERIRELADEASGKVEQMSTRLQSVLREKNQIENRLADQIERAQSVEQDRDTYKHQVKLLTEKMEMLADHMKKKTGELVELKERWSKKGSPRDLLAARKQIKVLEVQLQELSSQKR